MSPVPLFVAAESIYFSRHSSAAFRPAHPSISLYHQPTKGESIPIFTTITFWNKQTVCYSLILLSRCPSVSTQPCTFQSQPSLGAVSRLVNSGGNTPHLFITLLFPPLSLFVPYYFPFCLIRLWASDFPARGWLTPATAAAVGLDPAVICPCSHDLSLNLKQTCEEYSQPYLPPNSGVCRYTLFRPVSIFLTPLIKPTAPPIQDTSELEHEDPERRLSR